MSLCVDVDACLLVCVCVYTGGRVHAEVDIWYPFQWLFHLTF